MRTNVRRRSAFSAAVLAVALIVLVAGLSACGGSSADGGTGSGGDGSPGAASAIPTALTETYTSNTYGFEFQYPAGFEVQVEPDYIQSETDVFDLALVPTAETAEQFGFPEGNSVRLVVLVHKKSDSWQDVDSDGVAQQMIVSIQDYLSALDGLDATGVEPTDVDGFAAAQIAYSYDTDNGREDTWLLTLIEPEGDYRLEVQATSPAEFADLLEPAWTAVINSFTTF